MEVSNQAVNILKTAILLERRGKAFYTQVARQSESKSARKIFEMMAEEEDAHIDFLSRQFVHYEKTHEFLQVEEHNEVDDSDAVLILSEEIKKEISAASFEAAAISAAIDFENRAIAIYSERADQATDLNEKALYKMLADWEKGHHHLLHRLNEDLKEQIWNDNNFWPF
ncbi:MAG TPA: ferritin family protein [Bacteroidales bacterium]|nr:ferritin family protein [Bacteroidales bacterium]HQQ13350.1 ferritin family protein [Bacteroidales bacterium]